MSDLAPTAADGSLPIHRPAVFVHSADVHAFSDMLNRLRRDPLHVGAGGPAEASAWCRTQQPPGVLLVDISHDPHPLQSLLELVAICGPSCNIVVIGERQDVDLYRSLLNGGASDYLVKPVTLDVLAATLALTDEGARVGAARTGRTVAITGASGGCGVSTVAAGLGQLLSGQRHTPCALVDFDRRKGDLPLLLGLDEGSGLDSVLAARDIDVRLLQRALSAVGERLHLLAQAPSAEIATDPEQVLQLGGALCRLFSLSLWDLPASLPPGASDVLAHADVRVVLTDLTVQDARSTHRLLASIGDESSGQRLLLVANHTRHAAGSAVTRAQFEAFVGRPIDAVLPYAGASLSASLLAGPLNLTAAGEFRTALLALADQIAGRRVTAPKPASVGARLKALLTARPRLAARAH